MCVKTASVGSNLYTPLDVNHLQTRCWANARKPLRIIIFKSRATENSKAHGV